MSSIPSIWIWLGIIACITLSALFAGLNLAIFSLSQLRLQLEADGGNKDAARVLDLRKNSNQVLATVVWGNVGTNVCLTLLSDSVLAGLGAFFFSAVMITLFGEIAPQAYFSRNALRMTARFLPFLSGVPPCFLWSGQRQYCLIGGWVLKVLFIFTSVMSAPWLRAPLQAVATLVGWKRPECRTFSTSTTWRLPKRVSP
jgi:CBS domain containing-hemolysin-like protein